MLDTYTQTEASFLADSRKDTVRIVFFFLFQLLIDLFLSCLLRISHLLSIVLFLLALAPTSPLCYVLLHPVFLSHSDLTSDWLPLNAEGHPAFTKGGADGLELWPAILEKGYAKLYSSYGFIEAGKV